MTEVPAQQTSSATPFPSRTIRLVVPFPHGGVVDAMGRGLAEAVRPHLAASVEVENKPGDDGTAGMSFVALAQPDGYTIGLAAIAILTAQPQLRALPYQTPDDWVPIIRVAGLPTVLYVRSGAPWKGATELLDHARAHPGKVKVGVPGIGRISHLNLEHLKLLARVDLTVVPYEGPRQVAGLLDGEVDMAVGNQNPVLEPVREGRIRVVGVFQAARNPRFPDAPTFKELGYDVVLGVSHFLVAPKATSSQAARTLHDAFRKALDEPSLHVLAAQQGFDVDYAGPDVLATELSDAHERLGALVRHLGLTKP